MGYGNCAKICHIENLEMAFFRPIEPAETSRLGVIAMIIMATDVARTESF
jgi:hypothetical protein